MNGGVNELFRLIVPLTFLAIWAVTSILNRETRPQPGRPMQGLGPRPGGGGGGAGGGGLPTAPGMRPAERPGTALSRDPALRWGNPPGVQSTPPSRPIGRRDEEILVIGPEHRADRLPAPRPGASAAPPKRTARAKAAPTTAAKRAEPTATRARVGSTATSVQQQLAPLDSASLSGTPTANAASQAATAVYDARPKSATTAPLFDLRSLVGSRDELRKAIIVNEVLQPPVALRKRRRTF
jgi:hypothetical protein